MNTAKQVSQLLATWNDLDEVAKKSILPIMLANSTTSQSSVFLGFLIEIETTLLVFLNRNV